MRNSGEWAASTLALQASQTTNGLSVANLNDITITDRDPGTDGLQGQEGDFLRWTTLPGTSTLGWTNATASTVTLSDTDFTGQAAVAGSVLTHNGTNWIASAAPEQGNTLVYDEPTASWVPTEPAANFVGSVATFTARGNAGANSLVSWSSGVGVNNVNIVAALSDQGLTAGAGGIRTINNFGGIGTDITGQATLWSNMTTNMTIVVRVDITLYISGGSEWQLELVNANGTLNSVVDIVGLDTGGFPHLNGAGDLIRYEQKIGAILPLGPGMGWRLRQQNGNGFSAAPFAQMQVTLQRAAVMN